MPGSKFKVQSSKTAKVALARRRAFELRSRRAGMNFNFQARMAYVMLETVIATGLLIVGLGVIGAQLQDSNAAVHKMRLKTQAVMLAETQLAMMDLGLVKLDSVDEVQEGDFGSRYPDWGWRLITEPTSIDGLFRITVEVQYVVRQEDYREDSFDHEHADTLFRASAFRQPPHALDLAADFGLNEDELKNFTDQVGEAQIPCFEGGTFDPTCLASIDVQDLFKALPALQKLGLNLGDLQSMIPPDLMEQLQKSGLMDQVDGGTGEPTGQEP